MIFKKVALFVLMLLFAANLGVSVEKVFTVTVKRVMGEYESRDDIRAFSALEAKRQALEQAGTYLQAETVMRDYKLESEEVTALAAGVLSTEQSSEEWGMEGGHFVIWLTYEITIDPDDVDNRIKDLLKNREKVEDYKRLQADYARIIAENKELKRQLEKASADQVDDIKAKRKQLRVELSAVYWFFKGLEADDFDDKIEYYSNAIEIDPNYADAYNNRGLAYHDKYFYDRAIIHCDKAIADYSKAIEIDPNLAEAYSNRGVSYANKDDYDHAIADYSKAIEIDPNDAEVYNKRGVSYSEKGDYDRAIADYNKAIEINPNLVYTYLNLRGAYNRRGDYDRAIADYSKMIEIDPNDADAYNNRGFAYYNKGYYNKGYYDQAIADLSRAIEIGTDNALAYYIRGIAYDDKGEYDKAIADFSKAIEIDPNDAEAYYKRGLAYFLKGGSSFNYDRAIADFSKAIEIDPNYAEAYFDRGWVYKWNGDKAKARRDFLKARKLGDSRAQGQLDELR